MSEWWTYSLSDFLMFSAKTYYRLFELYNRDIWPGQLLAVGIALAILACAVRGGAASGRIAALLLAACWLWVAWGYFADRYATINSAASWFAIGFGIEALLLVWTAARGALVFAPQRVRGAAAGVLLFAMLGYPFLARAVGRPWQQAELFGVAPDPTALATLAVLALASRTHWMLLPIPLLWCAISAATLWTMRASDAWVIPLATLPLLVLFATRVRAPASNR